MLVALLFETDRAPYVVKNPKGGQVELEVPWRELTKTRTARRSDLIRLLEPLILLPSIEILSCNVKMSRNPSVTTYPNFHGDVPSNWQLEASLYIVPNSENRLIIPFHRCKLLFQTSGLMVNHWDIFRFQPPIKDDEWDSNTVKSTSSEVVLEGAGKVIMLSYSAYEVSPTIENYKDTVAKMDISLSPVYALVPVALSVDVKLESITASHVVWSYKQN
jgi:hypothetical protein